jgi:hypothetical protein
MLWIPETAQLQFQNCFIYTEWYGVMLLLYKGY